METRTRWESVELRTLFDAQAVSLTSESGSSFLRARRVTPALDLCHRHALSVLAKIQALPDDTEFPYPVKFRPLGQTDEGGRGNGEKLDGLQDSRESVGEMQTPRREPCLSQVQ